MLSPRKYAVAESLDVDTSPDPQERQSSRRSDVWIAGRLSADELTIPCDVINVSVGGVRIRSAMPCPEGTEMTLEVDGHAGIAVSEAWRRDGLSGLRFMAPDEIVDGFLTALESANPSLLEQRRHRRCSVLWTASIFSAGRTLPATVLNLSAGGARVRLKDAPILDDRATISIDRFGDFAGRLVWRVDNEIGLEFLDPPDRIVDKIGETLPRIRDEFERQDQSAH